MQPEAPQHQGTPGGASSSVGSQQNKDAPPQKSARGPRVVRACDECRARKIKCDGRQPCLHCTMYTYDCTYDRPNVRTRRMLSQKEIIELESKLQRAQNILKAISPELDVDSPNLEADMLSKLGVLANDGVISTPVKSEASSMPQDIPLETVLEATGQLDLDEQGNWSYHGHLSSSAFHRRLGEQFSTIGDKGHGKNTVITVGSIPPIEGSPRSPEDRLFEQTQDAMVLPPKDVALDLISSALDEGCALLKFVHEPSFYSMFHRMYLISPENYGYEENKFLPLLFAALAVGYLFSNSERTNFGYTHAVSQGGNYFVASRNLLDITECRDIWSLQALVFMIIFLQSSAKMSTCHSYISAAMAASLQMGLHRNQPEISNPIERETRKRIFFTIRSMETYVIALLGLPRLVSDGDIDQKMPLEIDDQYITKGGVLPMPDGQVSVIAGFNANSKLSEILAKVVTNVYATKRIQKGPAEKPRAYVVDDSKVREVERDLQLWAGNLPMQLRPGADSPPKLLRVQHLLRLAFTHVQLVLYRPFLHYISFSKIGEPVSGQCYAYAAACVDVGRNVIHNAREMEKQNAPTGPYWFSIYTTFCATLALSFYVWENADIQSTLQTLKDAEYGRDILVKLSYKSIAAVRHSETLATIFNSLPERLGKGQRNHSSKAPRKRQTPTTNQDEALQSYENESLETPLNSSENIQQTNPSNSSRVSFSTQAANPADFNEPQPVEDVPLNPLYFPTPQYNDFARFLGPDSIGELFRLNPQLENPGEDFLPPNMDSMDFISLSQDFNPNLDQYVSGLELQVGDDNDVGSFFPYTSVGNGAFGGGGSGGGVGVRPFIPISPYLMQMYGQTDEQAFPWTGPER